MIGKEDARTRVWGNTKGMLFRIFKKSPSVVKLFVVCFSATPLTKESIEMRIPPSCNTAALASLLIPRTNRMYTPWEGEVLGSNRKPTHGCLQRAFQQNLWRFKVCTSFNQGTIFFMLRPDHSTAANENDIADVLWGGNDGERDGKKQTKNQIWFHTRFGHLTEITT